MVVIMVNRLFDVTGRNRFMNYRKQEGVLIHSSVDVSRGVSTKAKNSEEANYFRIASMVIRSSFPSESNILLRVSDDYFSHYPDALLSVEDALKNGLIVSLSRLRDSLTRQLQMIG